MSTQILGLDIGRGFVKGYTKVNGIEKESIFKSVIGEGRDIDLSNKEKPIYIDFDSDKWFVGKLAEQESQTAIRNSKDSKITKTVQVLMAAALSELVVEDKVDIMLGVPYKSYRKSILEEVKKTYQGKTIKVKDKINGGMKEITINRIEIGRESDAALYWEVRNKTIYDKCIGMVNVGFRSTEFSFFDKGLIFNDKKSDTIEFGNRSVMSNVKDKLLERGIIKDLNEIDSSTDYDKLKKKAYDIATETIEQNIEDRWINLNEMDIYISGGTSINMNFDKQFIKIENPQMATAKGLYIMGIIKFGGK